MDPPPTRKPRVIKPFATKSGPRGPNAKNRPATSAQPLKKVKPRLTNSDWMEVYDWVDKHPHATQAEVVKHFATRQEGALSFDQGSLSRNLRKRSHREAEVTANPAALSSKRARIVTRPDVDQALWKWVQDRMSKSRTVSGPELSEKRKIFEERFKVPEVERLSETGWQQAFCKRYGLKELKRHGEAASADPKVVEEERATQQEILAKFRRRDRFNADEGGLLGYNVPDRGMATMTLSGVKKSKQRITILFACNADGSEKLPLFFIGKSAQPRCFQHKSGKDLGFYYRNNKKAWMTAVLFEEWIRDFDNKMRQQNRKVCLHLDNFSGHYINYEPTNITIVYFGPNLTSWVQPLDAGIIRCFKAHYRRRFCKNALERDELGEADIYKISFLQVLQMATAAWDDVTPETIKNCWDHTGIQRDPITIRLPAPTLVQRGWSIILKFASKSEMTLPQAEAELEALFKDQYNDEDWRPALKAITECEPEDDVIETVSRLRESMAIPSSTLPPISSGGSNLDLHEYNDAVADLDNSIKVLKRRNRLFQDVLTAQEFIELDGEEEEEEEGEVKLRTDEEIVGEVTREMARLNGEAVDEDEGDGNVDDNDEDDEDEVQVTLAEMMDAAMKLESGAPMVGGCGPELSNLCRKFRVEVRRMMMLEARQTTLEDFFPHSQ